jgi:tetratricopeptide (TPR) repeat protein
LADRALAFDPELAEAYAARARALTRAWAPAEIFESDFRRALELQPNSADIRQWHALFLAKEARHAEARVEIERGVLLDPLAPGIRTAASNVALTARRYDMAAREAERALALEPGLIKAREQQAVAALLSGNVHRCVMLSLGPYVGVRAMCLHSLGEVREAAQIADSLRAAFSRGTVADSNFRPVIAARGLAEYYAWTGNAGESLAWLERAYAISPEGEDFTLIASGIYDKIQNDPRFKAGLQRVHTEVYERVQRARIEAGRR